jgi:hypothetical protein
MMIAAAILFVSAATADDPILKSAARRQKKITAGPSERLISENPAERATEAYRRVGIRLLPLSGEFPGGGACLLIICPGVHVAAALSSLIPLVRVVRWDRARLRS